jgi:hypothetical protein
MNEETVTISKKEYESLKDAARWLQCLENAGVDNWEGNDYAYELWRENEQNEMHKKMGWGRAK